MNSNTLFYKQPAEYWTQALPLGNGFIGAMCFSGVSDDKISLNHDSLWTGHPRNVTNPNAYESYLKAQKYTAENQYVKAHKELEKGFQGCWSQAYMPFGDIDLKFNIKEYEEYSRTLDLTTAVLTSAYRADGVSFKKTSFVSSPADVFIYRVESDKDDALSFTLSVNCKLKSEIFFDNNALIIDGECPSDADTQCNKYPCNSLVYSENDKERGILFRGAIKIISDGIIECSDNKISVTKAKYADIYFAVKSSYNGFDKFPAIEGKEYKESCLITLNKAINIGFEKNIEHHIDDYKSFYDRVELSIGDDDTLSPTDERLIKFSEYKSDLSLYVLLFNFGRYLLISSSRQGSTATNLQGIWNDSIRPPWNSNYTVNINTQMNYWCALMCNLPELMDPLVDLIKTLSVTGENVAKDFYHAKGFVVHHNADIWGHAAPVLGSPSWVYWQGASGWLCRSLFEIYEYTLDEEFLKNTAYPIMKKASEFYLDVLVIDSEGNLMLSPATSPENHFSWKGRKSAVSQSTAMINSIILDLFLNFKKTCEILNIKDNFYSQICEAVDKIQPLKIGKHGELLEWNKQLKETEIHHRHISHLYALHPANLIKYDDTDLINACRKTLEIRGDDGTGWSLAWKINFWARLRDGNHALELIDKQLRPVPSSKHSTFKYSGGGGTYLNMFDAHPPFQIDGNFGAVSGICEMLLQSDGENIYILPALPEKFKNGYVKGLKARGNVTVDVRWEDGKITDYKIHGNHDNLNIVLCR